MAVRAFRIENFMAFGEASAPDEGWIELPPICLLFGRNSSGKSAVIRALRLLKQSLIDASPGSPFAYSVEDGVDVGSFREMAHQPYPPDDPPIVRFGFRCDVSPVMLGRLVTGFSTVPIEEAQVDLTLGYGWLPFREQAGLVELLIETEAGSITAEERRRVVLFRAEMIQPASEQSEADQWWYQSDILTGENPDEIWELVTPQLVNGFLPQLIAPQGVYDEIRAHRDWDFGQDFEGLRVLLRELQETITGFLEKIEHAQPMRPEPKRRFVLDDSQQRRWQQQGLHGYLQLLRGEGYLTRDQVQELNRWLQKLDLGDSIWAEMHTDSPKQAIVTALNLDEGENRVRKVNLADMGYGVSQVLPVLIQAILAEPGQLVIVEQPELHLHPAAQAELGDLFLQLALSKNGPRFLLETHSEHLILRLMRRMRNTARDELPKQVPSTTPGNIGVYVTSRDKQKSFSRIHRMEISTEGRLLEPWPGGFFEEGFRERFAKEETEG